jgi:hypothetical protein
LSDSAHQPETPSLPPGTLKIETITQNKLYNTNRNNKNEKKKLN